MISEENEKKINELINKGWEFMLIYTDDTLINRDLRITYYKEGQFHWEADFTKRKKNGKWDNHISGHSLNDVNECIAMAYDNIKKHRRLKGYKR
jgi:hypothetical protein